MRKVETYLKKLAAKDPVWIKDHDLFSCFDGPDDVDERFLECKATYIYRHEGYATVIAVGG